MKKAKHKLDIHHLKTCDCKDNHINCLTPKEWTRSQVAIWELYYEKRDVRDKNVHPASFPISLPQKCIELFTHEGELVLDPFCGIGTTLIVAMDTKRKAVGFDLNNQYIDYFKSERVSQLEINFAINTKQIAIAGDTINIPKYLNKNTVALCVTSPPYANMLNRKRLNKSMRGDLRNNEHFGDNLQYSNNPRDLGTMKPKEYAK